MMTVTVESVSLIVLKGSDSQDLVIEFVMMTAMVELVSLVIMTVGMMIKLVSLVIIVIWCL